MTEPKAFASLTSGLLARKGGARPAMRRQVALNANPSDPAHLEDLGWNDMGLDAPDHGYRSHEEATRHAPGLSPMGGVHGGPASIQPLREDVEVPAAESMPEPAVRRQQRSLAVAMPAAASAAPAAAAPLPPKAEQARRSPRAQAGAKGNFAFTLRLDADRHLRLRLASAATNRSAQQILVALVDDYFAASPHIAALAAQVSDNQGKTGEQS